MQKLKKIRDQLFRIFWSRLGRNLIFWIFFIGEWLYNVPIPKTDHPERYILFRTIMFGLMIIYSYTNNLFLIPKLLVKKKYWFYFFSVIILTYAIAFAIDISFDTMMLMFPGMKIEDVSFITTDVPLGYTWKALSEGTLNYFYFMVEWIATFTMAWYMSEFAKQQKSIEQARKKQMEAELNFLKSQMNPHFLFNTLNNLYGLALNKSENTPEIILKLSSILRYLLYDSVAEKVDFEKEKEVMEAYISLELLRLKQVDHLEIDISSDTGKPVPPLLWLPILENIFKHATRVIANSYYIEYKYKVSENSIHIFSKNNYKQATNDLSTTGKNGGIGLQNLEKRLTLLYPNKFSLKNWGDADYYHTEMNINLV